MAAPRGFVLPHARAWRERLWLTQQELAGSAGIKVSVVSRAEQGGAVSIPTVRNLAKALGITPDQLCYGEPERVAV